MNMGGDVWGWGMGGLWMVLFWGAIIVALVVMVKWLAAGSTTAPGKSTPLDTLKERYAKGEIGKDEFEQKKRDIGG